MVVPSSHVLTFSLMRLLYSVSDAGAMLAVDVPTSTCWMFSKV